MATEAFTVKTESEILHQLDSFAGASDRSRNDVINQAIREYLKTHASTIDKVNKGMSATEHGDVKDHQVITKEQKTIAEEPATRDDFFGYAGIWVEREIDQATIRAKAWPHRRV